MTLIEQILVITAVALALVSATMLVVVLRQMRHHRAEVDELRQLARAIGADGTAERVDYSIERIGVVMNPSKFHDVDEFRQRVRDVVAAAEGATVGFYDTTRADPGRGQAQQALEDGCDLVFAAGGDGTVRMVAGVLAGSEARMAIIPSGTGNLLARNLGVPLDRPESAVLAALAGRDRRIDVGWLRTGMSAQEAEQAPRDVFLVIAGYGADAEMIGYTDPAMKARIGWFAYVFGGLRTVLGRGQDVTVTLPSGDVHRIRARTVLVGNVGKLPGGFVLMPDAGIDNGVFEVLVAGWRSAAGFSQVLTQVVSPRLVGGPKISTMERFLTPSVRVSTPRPQPVQLDGDTEHEATHLIADIEPRSLLLRVPARD